jgi:fermentation-respiration switch protein FrsA (DUF1100 family)
MARRLVVATIALGLVLAVAIGAAAWHYSNEILRIGPPSTFHEQRVLAAEPEWIRLSRDRESLQPGTWALEWPDGFGRVGRVLRADSAGVVREFRAVIGAPPVGGWASLRGVSRSADPLSMLGLSFETVAIQGPLGKCPAWWVPGADSTWVVYVHGRGANRAEGLRALGVYAARGLPSLLVSYRNDPDAPRSPDGFSHLGLTEWEDLEAAVRYAIAAGARDVVLTGFSMGGQVVMQFMVRSELAPRVVALVLESPLLDWDATLAHRARAMRVPAFATWLGKRAAAARARLDWDQLDRVTHVEDADLPILVFHNVQDTSVPASVSESFVRLRPNRATLVLVEGGNHVDAWNADPARYADVLGQWLHGRGIGSDPH